MFKNKRYLTSGINKCIPIELQAFIWNLIDTMDVTEKDYLQVFRIKSEDKMLEITHSQETPNYKKIHTIANCLNNHSKTKVYVIDNGEYSTMLLAEEY